MSVSPRPRPETGLARRTARRLPPETRSWLGRIYRRLTAWPPVGLVRFGALRRVTPFTRDYGVGRGHPIDRYYIDDFLRRHVGGPGYAEGVVRGRVLEVGEALYAGRFGDPMDVDRIDILDVSAANPNATVIADLSDGKGLPSDAFDCVICTQTLLLIYDIRSAVGTLRRILRPGGTLLVTIPGISQICRPEMDLWGDYWRFTTASARRLFEEVFEPAEVWVESYGNVLSACAFLYGLATEDLKRAELDVRDPDYQLLIAIKAVKGGKASPSVPERTSGAASGTELPPPVA